MPKLFIHRLKDWPQFRYDEPAIAHLLGDVRYMQGCLLGKMSSLGFELREESTLATLTRDVIKTSQIEGERLNELAVRSSLARRLGIDIGALPPADRHVEGIVEVMLDATRNYDHPLTEERLFGWHSALFPTGRSGAQKIITGGWRLDAKGPMQVVSGGFGRELIHYEAPAANRLPEEMMKFLDWFNSPGDIDLVIKAALAHFWFVTIHPFDDGNGRLARAIADAALAQSEKSPHRFYSMSAQIQADRADYYEILERSQKQTLDITGWVRWFLKCLNRSIAGSEKLLEAVLAKANFWKARAQQSFNDRQRKLLNQLLDGFEGKLTTSKWAKIAKCSQDTALRDINELLEKGILQRNDSGGRSASYELKSS